jgi:hypothetical protein
MCLAGAKSPCTIMQHENFEFSTPSREIVQLSTGSTPLSYAVLSLKGSVDRAQAEGLGNKN